MSGQDCGHFGVYETSVATHTLRRDLDAIRMRARVLEQTALAEESKKRRIAARRLRHCSGVYYTQFLPFKYAENNTVKQFCHMPPQLYEDLLSRLRNVLPQSPNSTITLEEKLVCFLDFVISGQSLKRLSVGYGISAPSVSHIIRTVAPAVVRALKDTVKCPASAEEWRQIANEFYTQWNLPHCIGALDGKHIRIKAPPNSGSQNFNYKHFYSITLLAVVDANRKFLCYDLGSRGRNNDAHVFRTSSLYAMFDRNRVHLPEADNLPGSNVTFPYFIAADGAFGLRRWLLKPFGGRNRLSADEERYNYRFSRARRVVENAFGTLATRFRLLYTPIDLNEDTTVSVIRAMIHLHNYLIDVPVIPVEGEQFGRRMADFIPANQNDLRYDHRDLRYDLMRYLCGNFEAVPEASAAEGVV